jgi:urease gamma subunit
VTAKTKGRLAAAAAAKVEDALRNEHALEIEEMRSNLRLKARDLRSALTELGSLRKAQGIIDELEAQSIVAKPIKRKARDKKHLAAAVFAFSDWHAGETVTSAQVNGLNEYTPEIFRERAEAVFRNGLSLVELHRNEVSIPTLVVGLVGDMMTGFLHEDLKLTNSLSPPEEIIELQEALVSGFDYLLAYGDFERILVPCAYGNHGRGTMKPSHAAGAKTSWEVLLYRLLAKHYAKERRIEFVVPDGAHTYTDVYGTMIRWHHGDGFSYGGGVGGVLIPGRKAVSRWSTYRHADQTVVGHWHQLTFDRDLIVNGSLIGPTAYGMKVGSFEPAQQAFFLVDERYGRTAMHPILVEKNRERRR